MAWFDPNFAPDVPGNIQNTDKILRDLCGALNERQELLGRAQTVFFIGDGSTKSKPTEADFDGFKLYAPSPPALSDMMTNIIVLRSGIEDLFLSDNSPANAKNVFIQADRTRWTLSALLSLGSFGNSWLTVTRINDQNGYQIWEQLREAFDQLIYVAWFPRFRPVLADLNSIRVGTVLADTELAAEQAWDACKADTPFTGTGLQRRCLTKWGGATEPGNTSCSISEETQNALETSNIHGTVTKGVVVLGTGNDNLLSLVGVGNLDQNVNHDWDERNETYTVEPGDDGTERTEYDQGVGWPDLITFGDEWELADSMDDSTTTAEVLTGTGAGLPSTPFSITVGGSELMTVIAVAGDELTVARGRGGSTAVAHDTGDPVTDINAIMTMIITEALPADIPSNPPNGVAWEAVAEIFTALAVASITSDINLTRVYTNLKTAGILTYVT